MEGGGQGAQTWGPFREGMEAFLGRGTSTTRDEVPVVVSCGGRGDAYRNFKRALQSHPEALVLLLVDAEGPLKDSDPRKHLEANDNWECPHDEASYHLMVQIMEAWFIADAASLSAFVAEGGGRLDPNSLPADDNVEQLSKRQVCQAMADAVTQADTKYGKIIHGAELLGRIDPEVVRKRAPHCDRLFTTLEGAISGGD